LKRLKRRRLLGQYKAGKRDFVAAALQGANLRKASLLKINLHRARPATWPRPS
jgi:hypothetical protein